MFGGLWRGVINQAANGVGKWNYNKTVDGQGHRSAETGVFAFCAHFAFYVVSIWKVPHLKKKFSSTRPRRVLSIDPTILGESGIEEMKKDEVTDSY
jgi:hypothetical protein